MAKRKPQRTSRKAPRSRPGVVSDRPLAAEPAGPAPAAETRPGPAPTLIGRGEAERALHRVIELLTPLRVVAVTLALLVVIVPVVLWVRSVDVTKIRADQLFEKRSWAEAAASYEKIHAVLAEKAVKSHKQAKRSADTSQALAHCYLRLGRADEALPILEQAEQRIEGGRARWTLPSWIELHVLKGWALFDTGKPQEAVQTMLDVLRAKNEKGKRNPLAKPKHPLANYLMGRHYLREKNFETADRYYRMLANLPDFAEEYAEFSKAAAEYAQQLSEEEKAALDRVPEMKPETQETPKEGTR